MATLRHPRTRTHARARNNTHGRKNAPLGEELVQARNQRVEVRSDRRVLAAVGLQKVDERGHRVRRDARVRVRGRLQQHRQQRRGLSRGERRRQVQQQLAASVQGLRGGHGRRRRGDERPLRCVLKVGGSPSQASLRSRPPTHHATAPPSRASHSPRARRVGARRERARPGSGCTSARAPPVAAPCVGRAARAPRTRPSGAATSADGQRTAPRAAEPSAAGQRAGIVARRNGGEAKGRSQTDADARTHASQRSV